MACRLRQPETKHITVALASAVTERHQEPCKAIAETQVYEWDCFTTADTIHCGSEDVASVVTWLQGILPGLGLSLCLIP